MKIECKMKLYGTRAAMVVACLMNKFGFGEQACIKAASSLIVCRLSVLGKTYWSMPLR